MCGRWELADPVLFPESLPKFPSQVAPGKYLILGESYTTLCEHGIGRHVVPSVGVGATQKTAID